MGILTAFTSVRARMRLGRTRFYPYPIIENQSQKSEGASDDGGIREVAEHTILDRVFDRLAMTVTQFLE